MKVEKRKLTPPEIAASYGVDVVKIHRWIESGELRAIDGATKRGERPRYLVDVDDLEAFEESRAITPPETKPARRKKPSTPAGFVRHFR